MKNSVFPICIRISKSVAVINAPASCLKFILFTDKITAAASFQKARLIALMIGNQKYFIALPSNKKLLSYVKAGAFACLLSFMAYDCSFVIIFYSILFLSISSTFSKFSGRGALNVIFSFVLG